jgi:hypothetical protein
MEHLPLEISGTEENYIVGKKIRRVSSWVYVLKVYTPGRRQEREVPRDRLCAAELRQHAIELNRSWWVSEVGAGACEGMRRA